MQTIVNNAIITVENCEISYCKFLSANDTKATNANQSGYLISKSAWSLTFKAPPKEKEIIKINVVIQWQEDFETDSVITYYASKDEFRLTRFGRHFPFREESNTGDLWILCKIRDGYFKAYILSLDEDIENFFAAVNISHTETNKIISRKSKPDASLEKCFNNYILSLKSDFPSTAELAFNARKCYYNINISSITNFINNPDGELLNWIETEFRLFKAIENVRYLSRIERPFKTVEEFIDTANSILNRRKSRAGKSLEHQLIELFNRNKLIFQTQAITEGYKKPDFIFPNQEAYHNPKYEDSKLWFLGCKTTCKDRWRQILNEADRIKTKHLFTLQQGISKNQLNEMYKSNVCLVIPAPYIKHFPNEFKSKIITLAQFIQYVKNSLS